jgi:hypothetical protein
MDWRKNLFSFLYSKVHKTNKRPEMYICKSSNLFSFCYFCVAHNVMNFELKLCMLVAIGYTINHVQICFHNFSKLINTISFLNGGTTGTRLPKKTFRTNVHVRPILNSLFAKKKMVYTFHHMSSTLLARKRVLLLL